MLRTSAFAAVLAILAIPSLAGAWGAAHVGYTHAGPNGVYHVGRTAAVGPGGAYSTGHATGYGAYGGTYHAGYAGGTTAGGYHAGYADTYHYPPAYSGGSAYRANYAYVR